MILRPASNTKIAFAQVPQRQTVARAQGFLIQRVSVFKAIVVDKGGAFQLMGGEARALRSPCMPYGDLLSSLQIHQTSHFNGNGVEAVQCSCEARRYADLVLLAVVAVDFRLKLRRVPLCESHHAAKAEVVRSGIDVTFSACTRHVSGTILIRTQKRAAAMHFLLLPWFRWVV